jgi:hypothetical protein
MEPTYWMKATAEHHTPLIKPDVISFADPIFNNGFVGGTMLLWGKKIELVEENWPLFSIQSFAAQGANKGSTKCKGVLPAWVKAFYEALDVALVQKFTENDEERKRMLPKILKNDVGKYYTSLIKVRERKNPKPGESETLNPVLELAVPMNGGMFDVEVKRGADFLQYPHQVGDFTYVPGQKTKTVRCNAVHWSAYTFYKINVPKWGISQSLTRLDVQPGSGPRSGGRAAPPLEAIRAMQMQAPTEPVYYQAAETGAQAQAQAQAHAQAQPQPQAQAQAQAHAQAQAPVPAPEPGDEPTAKRQKVLPDV